MPTNYHNTRLTARRLLGAVAIASLIAATCLAPACDDDGPTQPKPVPPKDYVAYFYDGVYNDSNWYFAYRPESDHLDSVWLPYEAPPVISADGSLMFVSNQVDDVIDVVEVDSFTVVDQLPYFDPVTVSSDGQYVVVYRDGLYLLDATDYSVVLHDTSVHGGAFAKNNLSFYALPDSGNILKYDLTNLAAPPVEIEVPFGAVRDLEPSQDERRLYLYLHRRNADYYFAVLDVVLDSITFSEYLTPGPGEVALTPDDRYVFYSNGGSMLYGPGPPYLSVFDTQQQAKLGVISTAGILDPPYDAGVPIRDICVTPDGRWLVAIDMGFPQVMALDIQRMEFSRGRINPGNAFQRGLSIQAGP